MLNELKMLINEVRETKLKLEFKIEQTEKKNNNYIPIMKTIRVSKFMKNSIVVESRTSY